jgi:hypothetical protein
VYQKVKKYFAISEFFKNIVSSGYWVLCGLQLNHITLATLISVVAIVNFLHGFLGAFYGERYYQSILTNGFDLSMIRKNKIACLKSYSLALLVGVTFYSTYENIDNFVMIFVILSSLMGATYNINRGIALIRGEYNALFYVVCN